ncbi:MAG UNVERIFIED_CONTAM: YaeQ family protein [Rickettsiaceae bacterium]|jgi:uncharacterized protein YaeQ
MALKATIFKAELGVSDVDRGVYRPLLSADHRAGIRLETDERMMVRVLAFALNAK